MQFNFSYCVLHLQTNNAEAHKLLDGGLPQTVVTSDVPYTYDKTSRIKKRKFVPTEIVAYVFDFVDEFNKVNPKISSNLRVNGSLHLLVS
jgi:hypothetical protein